MGTSLHWKGMASHNQVRGKNLKIFWMCQEFLLVANLPREGYVQTIKGEGMPLYQQGTFGDLYVEYNVVLPSELSPEMKKSELQVVSLTCFQFRLNASCLQNWARPSGDGGTARMSYSVSYLCAWPIRCGSFTFSVMAEPCRHITRPRISALWSWEG